MVVVQTHYALQLIASLTVCKNSAFERCVFAPLVLYLDRSQMKKEIAYDSKRFLFQGTV
jgi:hypothetical protein